MRPVMAAQFRWLALPCAAFALLGSGGTVRADCSHPAARWSEYSVLPAAAFETDSAGARPAREPAPALPPGGRPCPAGVSCGPPVPQGLAPTAPTTTDRPDLLADLGGDSPDPGASGVWADGELTYSFDPVSRIEHPPRPAGSRRAQGLR
jgi:hypothetical protein